MPKDIVIRIGIAGHFRQDNLNLISKNSCKVSFMYRIAYKNPDLYLFNFILLLIF